MSVCVCAGEGHTNEPASYFAGRRRWPLRLPRRGRRPPVRSAEGTATASAGTLPRPSYCVCVCVCAVCVCVLCAVCVYVRALDVSFPFYGFSPSLFLSPRVCSKAQKRSLRCGLFSSYQAEAPDASTNARSRNAVAKENGRRRLFPRAASSTGAVSLNCLTQRTERKRARKKGMVSGRKPKEKLRRGEKERTMDFLPLLFPLHVRPRPDIFRCVADTPGTIQLYRPFSCHTACFKRRSEAKESERGEDHMRSVSSLSFFFLLSPSQSLAPSLFSRSRPSIAMAATGEAAAKKPKTQTRIWVDGW